VPVNLRAGVALQQEEPQFVWMELKAKGARADFRWHNEFGYAAPTYRLINSPTSPWPAPGSDPAAPELQVWWSEKALPSGESQKLAHAAGIPLAALQGQSVALAGNRVTLTTVKAESNGDVTVAFEGDEGTKAEKPCLRVEIDHPPGKPVWLRLNGVKPEGEEHRFYTAAGKYTAIFWGVSNPDAKRFDLTVISLDDFKANAGPSRHAVFHLDPPDPHDSDERLPRIPPESLK